MDWYNEELGLNIPEHVGIILDGNGRWAKKRHLARNFGHAQGSRVLEKIVSDASSVGIKVFTVYVFSTENWNRSLAEVKGLMMILKEYLKICPKMARDGNLKVRFLGRKDGLSKDILELMQFVEDDSKDRTGMLFQIALNYGGRDEITRAVRNIATKVSEGLLRPEDITEELISNHLDTAGAADPDLIIRTSGEQRTSNFLVWQGAYAELDFPQVLWPDFNKQYLIEAIERYNHRDRRFGGVKEE